jgi:O-antigen ligase
MFLAVNLAKGIKALTSPAAIAAISVLFILGVTLARGKISGLARGMIVGGWAIFVLTSPSSQFPSVLHFVAPLVAGIGAVLDRVASPPKSSQDNDAAWPWPARFLLIYLGFALLGCIASPYGMKNVFHWIEGVLLVLSAFYGISIGLGVQLLIGTFLASLANCVLALGSGPPAAPEPGVAATRLSGYLQPNHLAFAASVVIVGIFWAYPRYPRARLALVAAGLLCGYVTLASHSRTSAFALIAALAISGLSAVKTKRRGEIVVRVSVALLVLGPILIPVVVPWFNRGTSSSSLTSLTGRTDFWPLVVHMIEQRPIIGWGINAVSSPAVADQFQAVTTGAVQAHNAFLEAALIGGIPGAIAWVCFFFGTLIGSFRLPRGTPYRTLLIGSTILVAFETITESNPAFYGDMFVIVLLCAALYCEAKRATVVKPLLAPQSSSLALALPGSTAPSPGLPSLDSAEVEESDDGRMKKPWSPAHLVPDLLLLARSNPAWRRRDYVRQLRRSGYRVSQGTVATILGVHGLGNRAQRLRASTQSHRT